MRVDEAFRLVWSNLTNTRSMCPDVEKWHVRKVLADVLVETLIEKVEGEVDRWILGQTLIGPLSAETLAEEWYERNLVQKGRIEPPDGNYEDEGYQAALVVRYEENDREKALRAREVSEALRRLVEGCWVVLTLKDGREEYSGSLKS